MKIRLSIIVITFISTVLHYSYTSAFHVEPILSPFTEYLYSYDAGLGTILSNMCDCSEVKSCSCSSQLMGVKMRADIALQEVMNNSTKPTYFLESKVYIGNYKLYEEKTNVNQLQQMCSVFEDKNSYVVNKNYCIDFKAGESDRKTEVCANLLIKERGLTMANEQILCVRNTTA